jgi:hypothetical protein
MVPRMTYWGFVDHADYESDICFFIRPSGGPVFSHPYFVNKKIYFLTKSELISEFLDLLKIRSVRQVPTFKSSLELDFIFQSLFVKVKLDLKKTKILFKSDVRFDLKIFIN